MDVDVVIVGSGAGGLTAAVACAQSGLKVLVFEQQDSPGGWCRPLTLGAYTFSPAVQYMGELGPGGRMRAIYEGLGASDDLEFYELNPDGFDHVLIGSDRFDVPKGRDIFEDRLARRFPRDRAGIAHYLRDVGNIGVEEWQMRHIHRTRDWLAMPWRMPTMARWAFSSAQGLIEHHVKDPLLRAILSAQCGNHALPPSQVSALVHAGIVAHYFDGAFYPKGGAAALPRALTRALTKAGGEIHVKTSVAKILVEKRRAVGVRLGDGREVRARHVVSNADPHVTFGKLIDPEHLSLMTKLKLSRLRFSGSALALFGALDSDPRTLGLDSGNYWIYVDKDIDAMYRQGLTAWPSDGVRTIPGQFLALTTVRDPSRDYHGHHTFEALTPVGYDAFRQWAEIGDGERHGDYTTLKDELTAGMLGALERVVPDIAKRIVFSELTTPLTNANYYAATRGSLYGTEKSRFQVGPFGFQTTGDLDGLFLCGASTVGHGVINAATSGMMAAHRITGHPLIDLLKPKGRPLPVLQAEPRSPD